MTGDKYQVLAMRTKNLDPTDKVMKAFEKFENEGKDLGGVLDACFGMSGEVGELEDILKKHIFHEKELDEEHLKKELGDVMWYVAMLCDSMNWSLDEILQMNIDKLKARYPDGFSIARANNRAENDI